MRVFKFGGASVKDAEAVKNIGKIIQKQAAIQPNILMVVSAMGKTTNALEALISLSENAGNDFENAFASLEDMHYQIVDQLFEQKSHPIYDKLKRFFFELKRNLLRVDDTFDRKYDQIIVYGELLSTLIVADYLNETNGHTLWLDARNYISTDETWREGRVDWEWTEERINTEVKPLLTKSCIVTQGFIGRAMSGLSTSLGREGSDYSAAIFASCLKAASVTIWKDVPGILNADPKRIGNAKMFSTLSYEDAAEMTYYGATVIHPKTIKPLANRNIPLYVKSFIHPEDPGTQIGNCTTKPEMPSWIYKTKQSLLTLKARNLSSVNDTSLHRIFDAMYRHNLKINLLQSSATTLSICTNYDEEKIRKFTALLDTEYDVEILENLELLTIKNFNAESIKEYNDIGNLVLMQRKEDTLQLILAK